MSKTAKYITQAAIIVALYVVFSLLTYQFSYLEIQCRVAEALCMTIFFTPAGVPGVFLGCLITNLFGGSVIDMIFGTLTTLLAAALTYPIARAVRKKHGSVLKMPYMLLIPIPTVVCNALIIPLVLYYGYQIKSFANATSQLPVLGLLAFSVFAGEMISCYVFGPLFAIALNRANKAVNLAIE